MRNIYGLRATFEAI